MPYFTTSDGCRLHYQDVGSGKPLVLLPGWSQSAALFKHQLSGLSERYRVVALDFRGHGESDKPDHGYRISAFARDVHDFLAGLDLHQVNLLGWSMGCSVIWSHLELFGSEHLASLLLIDQSPFGVYTPRMSQAEKDNAGSVWDVSTDLATVPDRIRYEREAWTRSFVLNTMIVTDLPPEEKEWIIQENLKMPAEYAARLVFNHNTLDWRDVIPRITLPTLVVSGNKSFINQQSQRWIHEQIPGSKLEIFDTGHLMFLEEPERFNRVVTDFIG